MPSKPDSPTVSICDVIGNGIASELLIAIQFRVMADPRDSLASFRRVGQDYTNLGFRFELAGSLHGKSLTKKKIKDLSFWVQGDEILQAIVDRVVSIR
jgi:virulence-associated protein VapD